MTHQTVVSSTAVFHARKHACRPIQSRYEHCRTLCSVTRAQVVMSPLLHARPRQDREQGIFLLWHKPVDRSGLADEAKHPKQVKKPARSLNRRKRNKHVF